MDYLLQSIANYGFPMVVAVFLLVRMDKRLADLDNGIRDLTEAIRQKR
ncbi:YvrJ family protein [Megamonas hypermegale]|nr:YvrJ family protein [Megamonas hypermegale]